MRLFFLALLLFFMLPVAVVAQTTPCPNDTLVACILRNDTAAVRQCLKNGADPNAEKLEYDTRYTSGRRVHVYEVLRRPIFYAIEKRSLTLVEILVDAGASVNKAVYSWKDTLEKEPDFDGFLITPLERARKNKLTDIEEYLLAHNALTTEQQCLLGDRFYNLLPYCRKSADSLAALKMLIREHYDEIEFRGRKMKAYAENDVLEYNVKPAIDYLIDKHNAKFEVVIMEISSGPSNRYPFGARTTYFYFNPLSGLRSEYLSINLLEYLNAKKILTDTTIINTILYKKQKKTKRSFKYFSIKCKINKLSLLRSNIIRKVTINYLSRKMVRIKKRDMRKRPDLY